jgi:class 3 adenylate cyclase
MDVVGSTEMGERSDPESIRRVMSRLFDVVKPVLEHHGGTVEKFIGDAVMAVFGIPTVHEDDALRACRAALEIQAEIERLNKELERDWGVKISTRTGINTGEVIAGDPSSGQTLVTGDPVNTAARLEQSAPPGSVLIGEYTYRMVTGEVDVERI